jgi:hypothetical protein
MPSALRTNFTYDGVTYLARTNQEQIALGDNLLSIVVPEIMASQALVDKTVTVVFVSTASEPALEVSVKVNVVVAGWFTAFKF